MTSSPTDLCCLLTQPELSPDDVTRAWELLLTQDADWNSLPVPLFLLSGDPTTAAARKRQGRRRRQWAVERLLTQTADLWAQRVNDRSLVAHSLCQEPKIRCPLWFLSLTVEISLRPPALPETASAADVWEQAFYRKLSALFDADHRDCDGFTPLHVAAALGRFSVLPKLLERGHDASRTTEAGQTPLHFAWSHNKNCFAIASTCEHLVRAGANWDVRDSGGITPLQMALSHIHPRLEGWRGTLPPFDPNLVMPDGLRLLSYVLRRRMGNGTGTALSQSALTMVWDVVRRGVDWTQPNTDGTWPLDDLRQLCNRTPAAGAHELFRALQAAHMEAALTRAAPSARPACRSRL